MTDHPRERIALSEPEGNVVAHLGYLAAGGEHGYRVRFGLAEPDRREAGRRHPRGVRKRMGKALLQAGHRGAEGWCLGRRAAPGGGG